MLVFYHEVSYFIGRILLLVMNLKVKLLKHNIFSLMAKVSMLLAMQVVTLVTSSVACQQYNVPKRH